MEGHKQPKDGRGSSLSIYSDAKSNPISVSPEFKSVSTSNGILSKNSANSSKHSNQKPRSPKKSAVSYDKSVFGDEDFIIAEYVGSEFTSENGSRKGNLTKAEMGRAGDASEIYGISESDLSDNEDQMEEATESDYDTDLEMNHHKWVYPELYEIDTTGRAKYIRACQEAGEQPIKSFLRSMEDDNLNLRHHGLGPNSVKVLASSLESNTTIEAMDLEGNWMMAEGAVCLCRVLRENVYVTRLNLAENQIGNDGAQAVCNLLLTNKHIDHVNLSGNRIGNSITGTLHNVLTQPGATLKHLDLSHNQLDDTSALKIKEAMVDNESLSWLDISWNHFQSKGCVLIAEGLKENVGLKELTVSMNGFGLEGGKALGRALQANRTLRRLSANYCRLPADSVGEIALGVMNNDVLQILELGFNCLDADCSLVLLTGIQRNDSSALLFLELGNTRVSQQFKEIQDQLSEERALAIHHGGINEDYKSHVFEVDPMEAFRRNPMTKLKEWLAHAGYRLIDLLRHFDKDGSLSLSIDEFKRGIASTGIPLTEDQIYFLVRDLDKDGDGEIDFSELVEGDKEHRQTKRELLKFVNQREEEEKERQAKRNSMLPLPPQKEDEKREKSGRKKSVYPT